MFTRRLSLFRLFGFEVKVDASWLLLALLVTWTLAQGLFPALYPGLSLESYWWMGAAGALGLFISIVLHELSHSLVAARHGMAMKGITLFIFGGVAEMADEPPSGRVEFMMAIVGPLSSLVVALTAYFIFLMGWRADWPVQVSGVFYYIAYLNLALAIFNLLPAFPLDGGRMLRALLWNWKKNLRWATRIASKIGEAFGFVLMALGLFSLFQGDFISGLWWIMIGLFLRNAAQMSYKQVLTRRSLEGEKVRRFMVTDPVTVGPSISLSELVQNYIYRYHFKMYPVVANGRLLGCVTARQVGQVEHSAWSIRTVGEIAHDCSAEVTVGPDDDAIKALALMNSSGNSRLMVVEGDRLRGIITLKDLLRFLSLKIELDDLV